MSSTQRTLKLYPSVTANKYWLVIDDDSSIGFKTIKDLTDREQQELLNRIRSLFIDVAVEVGTNYRGTYFVEINEFSGE